MDRAERNRLVESCLPDLRRLAGRLRLRSPIVQAEDLEQAGAIGLIRAAERFDPARGVPFCRFAAPQAVWAMRDWIRRTGPRGAKRRGVHVLSLDHRDARDEPIDVIDPHGKDPADLACSQDFAAVMLQRLTNRERAVMAMLLVRRMSGREAAERLGISAARVSQLVRSAIDRQRERLAGRRAEFP